MDLRQLKYFVQIVESGSLAKASRQLYIAQPALSQHVAKLEAEVGKPLLIRTAKGVTPTENGAALHHHARFMLRQLDQALSIARQEPGTVHGMVSVGLAATTVCAVGVPFMRRIREKVPRHRAQRGGRHERPPGADDAAGPAGSVHPLQPRRRARPAGRATGGRGNCS